MKELDEEMWKKMHNVFMNRWSTFHVPIHSDAFAMDKQFCRRGMDEGIKKDIWSVMEDFSKAPGGKDFSKMKAQYTMFVDAVASKEVCVGICMTFHLRITLSNSTDNTVCTKAPDYPFSRRLPGSRTRSLVSCAQCLCVITVGLSRDAFTRKGGISSIRN
jgi:hypothetical protein